VLMSEGTVDSLILRSASLDNILPVTSECGMGCVFCSHHQNPSKTQTFRIPPRSLAQIEECLSLMTPSLPVVIGESVTRIIEGEPFSHPLILEILHLIRTRFPTTPIQITTNGSRLDRDMLKALAALSGIVLNLSLNSASPIGRTILMKGSTGDSALKGLSLLRAYGIDFHGSVVAMPHIVGWSDLRETIEQLSHWGAQTIRVFLPGFTRLAAEELRFEPELHRELGRFIENLRRDIATPLTCEPPVLDDLTPRIAGVLQGSPAERAGVAAGDLISSVDGTPMQTRVQAFKAVYQARSPRLELIRDELPIHVQVDKNNREPSGLVMDYDLALGLWTNICRKAAGLHRAKTLLMTGEFAAPLLRMALDKFGSGKGEIEIVETINRFFGGSIKAAGLLTVSDFSRAVKDYLIKNNGIPPGMLLLPAIAFDHQGRDLAGRSYAELADEVEIPVEIM